MGLSCGCDFEPEPGMTCWWEPNGYSVLVTYKRKRCCSCNELISIGDTVARVPRYKVPETDIQIRIYGDDGEMPLASHYLCEKCADINFSLTELGYCADPGENQQYLVGEYNAMREANIEYEKRLKKQNAEQQQKTK